MELSDLVTLVASVAAGIAVTCLVILLFDMMRGIEVDRKLGHDAPKRLPILIRLFMPFAPNFRFIARFDSMTTACRQVEEKIVMAGYIDTVTAEDFIAVRCLMSAFGVIMMMLCLFTGKIIFGFMFLGCCAFYPQAWLTTVVKKRHLEILKALPNVLDLLTLSVEAGRDFLTALRDILGRRKMDALGEELSRTFHEIQLGKSRRNALKELSLRVKQPDLTSVLNSIIQAEELGVSIGKLLRIQGDTLRNKRFTRAEKLANEAPVKILLPVVVFIFPAVMIILMVPILLKAFKMFA
ncbi:MAG: type II secretion system F family protein [Victivallaceae bacterium]|nr:type II secretion system F family protein [Victivallaceae bacterium]